MAVRVGLPSIQDTRSKTRALWLMTFSLEEAARSHFRFVDAQAVNDQKPSQTTTKAPAEEDPQMAAFQSMLSEYLKRECPSSELSSPLILTHSRRSIKEGRR